MAHGVQGVAGSNPAVPTSYCITTQERTVSMAFRREAVSLAKWAVGRQGGAIRTPVRPAAWIGFLRTPCAVLIPVSAAAIALGGSTSHSVIEDARLRIERSEAHAGVWDTGESAHAYRMAVVDRLDIVLGSRLSTDPPTLAVGSTRRHVPPHGRGHRGRRSWVVNDAGRRATARANWRRPIARMYRSGLHLASDSGLRIRESVSRLSVRLRSPPRP
jgi:hypothetical protein